jgi:CHAT domain
MPPHQSVFRVTIAGRISRESDTVLQVIGEFKSNRVSQEVRISPSALDDIEESIGQIRGFVESGTPVLREKAFQDMGSKLFELAFQGKVRISFERAYGANDSWLPCQFICSDPILAAWPWEYCFDEMSSRFLCRESSPVTRGLDALVDFCGDDEPRAPQKVRLLLALGVPSDDPGVTPTEEIKNFHNVFGSYLAQGGIDFRVVELVDATSIEKALDERACDIFHYFGHAGFKLDEQKGYLSIRRPNVEAFEIDADLLGQSLTKRGIRLVFLNACKSAQSSTKTDPAKSAVAGALLSRGIPVVIGTQFRMPDLGSHFFSAWFYNGLVTGKTVTESLHSARRAMLSAKEHRFYDWGIPAAYISDPAMRIFPIPDETGEAWRQITNEILSSGQGSQALAQQATLEAPSVVISKTVSPTQRKNAKFRITLVDLDAGIGFLPEMAMSANACQTYYSFQVALIPVPAGYQRVDPERYHGAQTYLPWLKNYLQTWKEELDCDFLCVLTKNKISSRFLFLRVWDFFAATIGWRGAISGVSTFGVREYAEMARVPFAKASFCLALAMVLYGDKRWRIWPHWHTYGCFFDLCWNRNDIEVALKKMKFDHQKCRHKIKDADQLAAIDALLNLEMQFSEASGSLRDLGSKSK